MVGLGCGNLARSGCPGCDQAVVSFWIQVQHTNPEPKVKLGEPMILAGVGWREAE